MLIRKRDGRTIEVSDDYLLQDGEAMMVPLQMMDSGIKARFCDSRGRPSGSRPGFLFADDRTAEAALADAHAQYNADISERWKSDRWQSQPAKPASSGPQPTFDSPQAALDAAHAQYRADISERWRRRA